MFKTTVKRPTSAAFAPEGSGFDGVDGWENGLHLAVARGVLLLEGIFGTSRDKGP